MATQQPTREAVCRGRPPRVRSSSVAFVGDVGVASSFSRVSICFCSWTSEAMRSAYRCWRTASRRAFSACSAASGCSHGATDPTASVLITKASAAASAGGLRGGSWPWCTISESVCAALPPRACISELSCCEFTASAADAARPIPVATKKVAPPKVAIRRRRARRMQHPPAPASPHLLALVVGSFLVDDRRAKGRLQSVPLGPDALLHSCVYGLKHSRVGGREVVASKTDVLHHRLQNRMNPLLRGLRILDGSVSARSEREPGTDSRS